MGDIVKDTWTVAEAKAKFSEVIANATTKGPQTITRSGRATAVVVSVDEWARKTRRVGTLADFFAASPLRGASFQLECVRDGAREVDL